MVHKKFIKRGGKVFGPYYYHSYREAGKVKKRYVKGEEFESENGEKHEKKNYSTKFLKILPFIFLILIIGGLLFLVSNIKVTGHVGSELENDVLRINLKAGELIPADSEVIISYENGTQTISLSDLIDEEQIQGNFYLENIEISGSGQGYGILGSKIVESEEEETGGSSETSEEETIEEPETEEQTEEENITEEEQVIEEVEQEETIEEPETEEQVEEEVVEEPEEIPEVEETIEEPEQVEEPEPMPESPITGGVITGSVIEEEREYGFGEEYLGSETHTISVDLSVLNLSNIQSVKINYNGVNIASTSQVEVEEEIEINETESNETIGNITSNITLETNASLETNITANFTTNMTNQTNVTISNITGNASIITTQYQVIINRPVRWKKQIKLEQEESVKVELPEKTLNLTVKKIENGQEKQASARVTTAEGEVIEIEGEASEVEEENVSETNPGITGQAIRKTPAGTGLVTIQLDRKPGFLTRIWNRIFGRGITGRVIEELEGENNVEVEILDTSLDYEIEYYTEGPIAEETNITNGKQITISADDELNYTNILAFSELPNQTSVNNINNIKLYHLTDNETREATEFEIIDENQDEIVDYIQWVVPHLSNQTYELIIIEITKAYHLDKDREFVSDIYEDVKERDDNWSEEIYNNEYVRVTFEQELSDGNDITFYPIATNGNPEIEVYEENGTEMVGYLTSIEDNVSNSIILSGIEGSQDVFDLKIEKGRVIFDYIVDPVYQARVFTGENLTEEGTTKNFTHLTIDTTQSPYDSLVLYMPFDDNVSATTAYDYSKHNNDGVLSGDTIYTTDTPYEGAMSFDGDDDTIIVSDSDSISIIENITISTWVYVNTHTKWNGIVGKTTAIGTPNPFDFYVTRTTGKQVFLMGNGTSWKTATSDNAVGTGAWHHIAVTRYGINVTFYLDGQPDGGNTNFSTPTIADAGNDLYIGNRNELFTDMNGKIDELMIFNTTLTEAQVQAIYNNQSSRFYPTGEQTYDSISIASGLDQINVTTEADVPSGTSLNLRAIYTTDNSVWTETANQVVPDGMGNLTFNIDKNTINVTLNYTFASDAGLFLTPMVLNTTIVFETFASDSEAPLINFTNPTPANASSQVDDDIYVNVSVSDNSEGDLYSFIDFDNSLVGWWGGENSATDESGYGNDGTLYDDTTYGTGKFNQSFVFDGINEWGTEDRIEIANSEAYHFDNFTDFTVSAWFKAAGAQASNCPIVSNIEPLVSHYEGWVITVQPDGDVYFEIGDQVGPAVTHTDTTHDSYGVWYHVAMTADRDGYARYYIDGSEVSNDDMSSVGNITGRNNQDLTFGNHDRYPYRTFNGSVDEVMIFNRTLNATEVAALYNATANKLYRNFTDNALGAHTFTAYAVDAAGNKNETEERTITIEEAVAPEVTLYFPLNNSGGNRTNIHFAYLVEDSSDVENCSLILNNKVNLTDTSITKEIPNHFFTNLSVGNYYWSVNCTDSYNNIGESETRRFGTFSYGRFLGRGRTTNLSAYNLSDVPELVIDEPLHGRINFSETVDLSAGADIDSYVNISNNRIYIDSTNLPSLNKAARLVLNNLTYTDPRPLKDGSVCTTCTEVSYSGGEFVFDVTGFSTYSAEETPEESGNTGGSSSGTGSSGFVITKEEKENTTYIECNPATQTGCEKNQICINKRCTTLFDLRVLYLDSPINKSEKLDFEYLIEGQGYFNDDIVVEFWIEKAGEIITKGEEVFYLKGNEEKIERGFLNIPSYIEDGIYDFYITSKTVTYGDYVAKASRSIEVSVLAPLNIEIIDKTQDMSPLTLNLEINTNKDKTIKGKLRNKLVKNNETYYESESELEINKLIEIKEEIGELENGEYELISVVEVDGKEFEFRRDIEIETGGMVGRVSDVYELAKKKRIEIIDRLKERIKNYLTRFFS